MLDNWNRWRAMAQGAWDYFMRPEYRDPWGGAFNNQQARNAIFQSLFQTFQPWAIVETGTYRGSTTEAFARTGLPVFGAELDPHALAFARMRMRGAPNVKIIEGDSRDVLRGLLDGPTWANHGANSFFYLDAHWNEDLPLAEEIDIIFSRCPDSIVMIDDFAVPGDAAYGYDDYGPGKALDSHYVGPSVSAHGLTLYYPSTHSDNETGAKRGCVVLAKVDQHGDRLATLPVLRAA
jgi:predicted O-methyltransferase YrrM